MTGTWVARHGDVELHVTEAGPPGGDPVVLLHGFPDSAELWRSQVAALAGAGHRVLAPDLRGYGRSSRPERVAAYGMPHLVGDVLAVLDAAGVARASLVGHDWGAVLAWSSALSAPDRVRRLVAVSVGHPLAFRAGGLQQALRSWYIGMFLLPGVAERVLPAARWALLRRAFWGGADPAAEPDLARQVEDLSRPGALTAGLAWYRANVSPASLRASTAPGGGDPVVRCPVMGVWSTDDPALTEAQMTASARYVSGPWRYERLEGVDHWVPVHAAERLDALLVDFLAT
jgi:pimeloyl-ACP methyl ester carboxylesterase